MCGRWAESAVHVDSHLSGAQAALALSLVPGGVR